AELPEKPPITMDEALEKAGGRLFKTEKHHDVPRALQKLWDALEYDNHAATLPIDLRVHRLVHGRGRYFHDSNVLWAYKLAKTDIRALNKGLIQAIRDEINATYGTGLKGIKHVPY